MIIELKFVQVTQTGLQVIFFDNRKDFINDGSIVRNILDELDQNSLFLFQLAKRSQIEDHDIVL